MDLQGVLADFEAKFDSHTQDVKQRLREALAAFQETVRTKEEEHYKLRRQENEDTLHALGRRKLQLQADVDRLLHERETLSVVLDQRRDMVELDVGGRLFTTTRTTLTAVSGSIFHTLLEGRHGGVKCDRLFFDRDGDLFRHVLAFLRDGVVDFDPDDTLLRRQLTREFAYFGISPALVPRRRLCLYLAGGHSGLDCTPAVLCYLHSRGTWMTVADMPQARVACGSAVLVGRLHVVGGQCGAAVLAQCARYDLDTARWRDMAPLPAPRTRLGVCGVRDVLYAVGGWDGATAVASVGVYVPETNKWEEAAALAVPRAGLAVCAYGDEAIVAAGGQDAQGACLSSVERFDAAKGVWEALPDMCLPRAHFALAHLGECLYAIGGSNGESCMRSVERYTPASGKWEPVAPLQCARAFVSAGVVNGQLLAVGGYDGFAHLATVEMYDPEQDVWKSVARLPTRLFWASAATG